MSFLHEYGLFVAKSATVVVAVLVVAAGLAALAARGGRPGRRGRRGLRVEDLGRRYADLAAALTAATLPPKAARAAARARRRAHRDLRRQQDRPDGAPPRSRVYVLDFHGDLRATEVAALREEVTAVVGAARPGDEVVVRLTNPGGTVNDQGFAAAQLMRVRSRGLRLVVCVDTVAASGGYLMACVADRILAAPFAVVGSIGVVAQIPNLHRLLDRGGIEVEQVTGGEFKRTVTPFTRTTDAQREKLTSQIEDTHALFKEFVARNRPALDVERVGTGEYWYGVRALELGLVDELVTSDDYLLSRSGDADVLAVRSARGRRPARRLAALARSLASVPLGAADARS